MIFSPFNGIEAQIKQKTHAESPKKRLTMEAIKNIPEEFWKSGFVLNGCKITFPCKLIDLMQAGNYKSRAGVAMIPPTAKDEYWGTTVKNEKGEIINAVIFNPTAQALPETDCIVNSSVLRRDPITGIIFPTSLFLDCKQNSHTRRSRRNGWKILRSPGASH